MNKICKHYYISGQVQGVYYRHFTKQYADSLSLTGWVRNLPDNRVEVLACGDKWSLKKFEHWLNEGPRMAIVTQVESQETPYQVYSLFQITDSV